MHSPWWPLQATLDPWVDRPDGLVDVALTHWASHARDRGAEAEGGGTNASWDRGGALAGAGMDEPLGHGRAGPEGQRMLSMGDWQQRCKR